MKYKNTKKFNQDISVLGAGTWSMGGTNKYGLSYGNVEEKESIASLLELYNNGVNLIDTAPVYGDEGASEKVVGKALKKMDREKVFVVTKFGNTNNPLTGKRIINNSYDNIMKEVEESLERLQTGYIDFYLMHYPDENTPIKETMEALKYLKEKGVIRYIGLSNPTKELILEAEQYLKIDAIQLPYSMVNRDCESLLKWSKEKGYITMSYGSLGAGILSGTYRELPNFDEKDIRNTFYPFFKEPMFSKVQCLLKDMDIIAEKYKIPVSHVALNWVSNKDYITTSLVGVSNTKEAKENTDAFSITFEAEDMEFLDNSILKNLA